jgi:hypothetical protein
MVPDGAVAFRDTNSRCDRGSSLIPREQRSAKEALFPGAMPVG